MINLRALTLGAALVLAGCPEPGKAGPEPGDGPGPAPAPAQANTRVDDLLASADRHRHAGAHVEALADYEAALELDPARGQAWIGRARVKLVTKDLVGARADLDKAVELMPTDGIAHFERGLVRFAQNDVQGAIEDQTRAIELQKDPVRAWVARGWAKLTIGDFAGAVADCDAAAKLDPDDGHIFKNRARARFEQGELAKALEDLDRALTINADDVAARMARAIVRARQGDVTGAMQDCDAVAALAPEDASARYTVGSVRAAVGDREGALKDYEVALERRGSGRALLKTLNNRALLRAQTGELDQALADLDRLLAAEPTPTAHSNRAWVLALRGDLDASIVEYGKAIELDRRGAAYAYRGRAYVRALKAKDAKAALEDLREAGQRTVSERRISSNWTLRSPDWERMAARIALEQPEYGPTDLLAAARADPLPDLTRERLARSHALLGLLAETKGTLDVALDHYRQAAEGQEHLLEVRWAKQRLEALGSGR